MHSSQTACSVRFLRRPSARGRQLYCRACNFKNVSALLAGNFHTCYVEPNGLPLLMDTWTWTWKLFIRQEKKYKHDTISHRVHDSMFFVVGRPLQRRWAHRLRKGHPRVLQCINRHCTMKGQTFGSVGKLNTHTSWDRAPSRLTRGTQLTIIMSGKETKTSVLNTTS